MSENDVLSSDPRAPPRSFARSLEVMPKYGSCLNLHKKKQKRKNPCYGLLSRYYDAKWQLIKRKYNKCDVRNDQHLTLQMTDENYSQMLCKLLDIVNQVAILF